MKSYNVINWLILGYFIILIGERLQSILRSATDKNIKMYGSGFNIYVNTLTILSLAGTVILLFCINRDFLTSLFKGGSVDYKNLCITAGVLLMSGMVHTDYTIPPIQFGAYGLLIIAMIIKTANNNSTASHSGLLWLSMVYLIVFSMAVPVMYHSEIDKATIFHIVEAITAAVLVVFFSYMMYKVFTNDAVNLFMIAPIAVAVIGDAIILIMRWKEKVNGFVLIFLVLSVIMWVIGKIVALVTHN